MIPRHQNVFNYIIKNILPEGKILELGCHKGHLLNELFQNGYKNLDAIDIKDLREYENLKKYTKFFELDLNKKLLPFQNNSFDLLYSLQVLEHLENPHFFARECRRVLKPGGKLIISMPHGHNLASKIRFLLKGNVCRFEKDNDHITFLTKNIFNKAFLKYFKLISETHSRGYLSDFGLKIYTPDEPFYNKLFGRNVYWILEKK